MCSLQFIFCGCITRGHRTITSTLTNLILLYPNICCRSEFKTTNTAVYWLEKTLHNIKQSVVISRTCEFSYCNQFNNPHLVYLTCCVYDSLLHSSQLPLGGDRSVFAHREAQEGVFATDYYWNMKEVDHMCQPFESAVELTSDVVTVGSRKFLLHS